MSDAVWNLASDGQNQAYSLLFEALETGVILGGSATSFSMKDGPAVAIFHGNFTVANGTITGGTISGFQVFFNSPADKLIETAGYTINFSAFKQAVTDFAQGDVLPIYHVLWGPPLTVHGANQFGFESLIGGFRDDHIFAGGGSDYISDVGGDDFIYGGPGDDMIQDDATEAGGVPGDDFLFGGDGTDTIEAGNGNDFISGGSGLDELDGGAGSDTADYAEKLDTVAVTLNGPNDVMVLVGGFVEDTIRNIENINGGASNDRLVGDGLINRLAGGDGDDQLRGNDGDDVLSGEAGRDRINGGKGSDDIDGGDGNDVLKGGKRPDSFEFDTALNPHGNVDKIKGFKHAGDMIVLDDAIFSSLDPGTVKGKYFHVGHKAADGNDHIIYDDGKLSYDEDGKGGAKQIEFAKLKGAPELHADDFLVA